MKKITAFILTVLTVFMAALGGMSLTVSAAAEYTEAVITEDGTYEIFDFDDRRAYGLTTGYDIIDFEAVIGLELETSGRTMTISTYTHNHDIQLFTGDISVYLLIAEGNFIKLESFKDLKIGEDSVEHTCQYEGLYKIEMDLTDVICSGYVYCDGARAYTCRISKGSRNSENNRQKWDELMKDANPRDYLSNADVTYPTSGRFQRPVHVHEWEQLSDEIIRSDDWSDEARTYVIVSYLAGNYAYDYYRTNTLDMESRADEGGAYEDQYYMFYNHVGVCWDYTNAAVIMLRHQGIPATSVENYHHTAVAVYLHDRWTCIDITQLARYACYDRDTDKSSWKKDCPGDYDEWFGYYPNSFITHDLQVWSPENMKQCIKFYGTL